MNRYIKSSTCHVVPNRVALMQVAVTLAFVAVLWLISGAVAAWSAALAGGISVLSTWYAGRKVFNSKAQGAEQFVQNIYLAQFLKLLLVTALFCIVFATVKVNFPVFVTTYAATLAVYGVVLLTPKAGLKIG